MAERRETSRNRAASQGKVSGWRHEPPQPRRGRAMVGALVFMGVLTAIVVADDEWAWRDSLRRMAQGEEIPAFRANEWSNAHEVRESLADDLLTSDLSPSVEERETRRNLALHTLIVSAGAETISRGGGGMGALMEELCLDVEWLEEMVYFCPMAHAPAALPILAHIYQSQKKKMVGMPGNRRFAAALAFEYALAGLDKEQALAAYLFFAASGQKHWLNSRFDELALWEMRVLAARSTDAAWSSERALSWFQRNSRLPAKGYVTLGNALGTQQFCFFGTQVDSPAFMAVYKDAAEEGTASVYVASGCSTSVDRAMYAATAACANGVPALVASNGSEASCLVDVNGSWEYSSPVPEGSTCTWAFFGQPHPDFVRLAALLGSDKPKTLSSARLAHMAQFLYDAGNRPLAHTFYREAVKVQPLNYSAWAAYHFAGAPREEMAGAMQPFDSLPGVAAALHSLLAP